jgi:AraC family transcriptional regulator
MQSTVEGFALNSGPKWRSWTGMLADVWDVTGSSGATGKYVSPHARLFVVLDETSAGDIILSDNTGAVERGAGRLSYIPPGLRTWSLLPRKTHLRHLDLHVDLRVVAERLGISADDDRFLEPRLMFEHQRIETLARLLAEECDGRERHELYGEGIAYAMLVELFAIGPKAEDMRGRLSPRRLRLATQLLADRCFETVRLDELAGLVGLSPSYFSAAFKTSTGLTPHQWQMQVRIDRVKDLLGAGRMTISEVAAACGFADQAHLTRVFKQYIGATPAAWLRRIRA